VLVLAQENVAVVDDTLDDEDVDLPG